MGAALLSIDNWRHTGHGAVGQFQCLDRNR
jgi:hypothetical protein